jgi:hypothetical protein
LREPAQIETVMACGRAGGASTERIPELRPLVRRSLAGGTGIGTQLTQHHALSAAVPQSLQALSWLTGRDPDNLARALPLRHRQSG